MRPLRLSHKGEFVGHKTKKMIYIIGRFLNLHEVGQQNILVYRKVVSRVETWFKFILKFCQSSVKDKKKEGNHMLLWYYRIMLTDELTLSELIFLAKHRLIWFTPCLHMMLTPDTRLVTAVTAASLWWNCTAHCCVSPSLVSDDSVKPISLPLRSQQLWFQWEWGRGRGEAEHEGNASKCLCSAADNTALPQE